MEADPQTTQAEFDAALLEALFTESRTGLYILDRELRVVRFNPKAESISGLTPESVHRRRPRDIAPDLELTELSGLAQEVLATGVPLRNHLLRGRPPGPGRGSGWCSRCHSSGCAASRKRGGCSGWPPWSRTSPTARRRWSGWTSCMRATAPSAAPWTRSPPPPNWSRWRYRASPTPCWWTCGTTRCKAGRSPPGRRRRSSRCAARPTSRTPAAPRCSRSAA
ncbi:PAS domain-containing protein [Streptacidiphilus sp. 4-A2]|nr:PAS domain-containing protein [Streptacidiphilus sp. 4-A2]